MLIHERLPQGHIYPQLTQAPVSTYAGFLNFFRGGHSIDDNVEAFTIANTMHAAEARKSVAEDARLHPHVGVVIVKDGKVLATGYRGETGDGGHGEYCAIKKFNADVDNDVDNADLSGCTVYTTLEPCTRGKPRRLALRA